MKARALGLGAVVAALLAGCGGTKQQVVSEVVVPNLIGKDALSAQNLLARRGLGWRWEDGAKPRPANGFLLADTIEGQAPAVGQHVERGTVVMLVPSSDKIVGSPLG